MESLPVVVLGFVLGMLHAADADHVIAVATIVGRERSIGGAARVGLMWGAGHTFTVFVVGSAIIVFSLVIPPRLELAMEFCVALMLIVLGVVTLSQVSRLVRDTLTTALAEGLAAPADGALAARVPLGAPLPAAASAPGQAPLDRLDLRWGRFATYQALRPLAIGVVHGLAGSAAVALLVLTQIRAPQWAVAYLLLFGIGTTAGMVLITCVVAFAFVRAQRMPVLSLGVQVVAGALSLALGGWMAWKLGVSDGLLIG